MNAVAVAVIVAACVMAGALFGLRLRRYLPDSHLTPNTQDTIKLGTNMMSVLTSLVLGLLITTAKGSSDAIEQDIRGYAADLILLDATLRDLGADAAVPRQLLRSYTARTLQDIWPSSGNRAPSFDDTSAGALLVQVRQAIRTLSPADAPQRWLQEQALQTTTSLQRQRWQIIEHTGSSVRPLIIIVVVCWIVAIFISFGLNANRNATVAAVFLVCSVSIGGAVFLVLEIDSPFHGLLRISDAPMLGALAYMDR